MKSSQNWKPEFKTEWRRCVACVIIWIVAQVQLTQPNRKRRRGEMVTFSKYFLDVVNVHDCTEIIHDGTCWESTVWNFTQTISGCTKFVLPLALVKAFHIFVALNLSFPLLFAVADHNENQENRQKCAETKFENFHWLLFGIMADKWLWTFIHLSLPVRE